MSLPLHAPDTFWILAGISPDSPLAAIGGSPAAGFLETGKSGQKWLKKNPDHPVLVAYMTAGNASELLELLSYLRERLQNRLMRLIIFADDTVRSTLSGQLSALDIHRLQPLSDWSSEALNGLLAAEYLAFQRDVAARRRRQSELALLTWLARSGRDEILSARHLREISVLLTELVDGRGLILGAQAELLHACPADLQGLQWADVLTQQFDGLELGQQAIRVQLMADSPLHQGASALTGVVITGSVLLPFRCYDEIRGYLLILLEPAGLQALDVSTVNLLEKTADQLRAHAERQQSEQRLRVQYERLQDTLKQLYNTQEQLFHAEKLTSLGQLAAGIAHEINNPVSYVLSNFEPLDEYISGMTDLIRMHDEFTRTLDAGDDQLRQQLLTNIHRRSESIDLEFVIEDIFALVSDSRKGLMRVCEIVKNLKNFAHKDQLEDTDFDLVECYRDSIAVLQYQLRDRYEIVEALPDGPALVRGNSGMIGQVVINLVQNALHAMGVSGRLCITIGYESGGWILSVHDSGPGVPEDILPRIFDPFFTTKPVGQGTGLGLSTVYTIINRHQGRISVRNDNGACFEVWLPQRA